MTPGSAAPAPRPHRLLLTLVIVMGAMIVLGVGVIVFEIGRRLFTPPKSAAEAPAARSAVITLPPEISVPIPEGAQVLATYHGDGRLWAEVQLADGSLAVWIIDLASGAVASVVKFKPTDGTAAPRR